MKIPESLLLNGKIISFDGKLYQLNSNLDLDLKLMKLKDPSLMGDHYFVGNKDISKVDFEKLIPPSNIKTNELESWFITAFAAQNIDSSIRSEILQIISKTIKSLPINTIHGVRTHYTGMSAKFAFPHCLITGQ